MSRLEGKVALVTGGARGMGAAEVRLFVSEGASVMVTDVLDEPGELLAAELGERAGFFHLDVCDEDGWDAAVSATTERFGRLDVLVNNAGILRFARVQDETLHMFRKVLDINLVGVFLGIKAVAKPMRAGGGGSIVNISSTSGIGGSPATAAYVASKFGVTGLTKAAAMDLGDYGIRVNSVHPGSVDTPMTRRLGGQLDEDLPADAFDPFTSRLPLGRVGTPDDVAPLVLFLASDESGYCTGAEFAVDGGQTSGDFGLV